MWSRSPSDFSELSPLSQASCQVVQSPGGTNVPLSAKYSPELLGMPPRYCYQGTKIFPTYSQRETGLAFRRTPTACAFQITAMNGELRNQLLSLFLKAKVLPSDLHV